jgi:hypothetical protein
MVLEGGGWHGFSDRMLSINITIFREKFSLLLFISIKNGRDKEAYQIN